MTGELEQPGSIGGSFVAVGDYLAEFGLLLIEEFRAATTDANVMICFRLTPRR